LNRLLAEQLGSVGYSVTAVSNWAEGSHTLNSFDPSVVILDIRLPDADGTKCLSELVPQYPVVVLTAFGSVKNAVEAMRAGAMDYLMKPVNPGELQLAVSRAIEVTALKQSYEYMRGQLHPAVGSLMVGESDAFKELVRLTALVAPSDATVLIEGESGVGKEMVAQSIHQMSNRASRNIVTIDCCTLQENLLESELFGHEKGAFTGADRRKRGLIEIAEGGTVFLDEIGETSPLMQAKLLRLLDTGEFRRLGGTQSLSSDARFIVASNRELKQLVAEGKFRSDLYYRLCSVTIKVPSLRERRSDIRLIANYFLNMRRFHRHIKKQFAKNAIRALMEHDWPGNIRELRNVVERAIITSSDRSIIGQEHLGLSTVSTKIGVELKFDHEPTLKEVKRIYLSRLLELHCGHRNRVATILGISERNTYRLIKTLKIECRPSDGLPEHEQAGRPDCRAPAALAPEHVVGEVSGN